MNLEPTEEQRQIVATVRRFVREEIVPLEAKLDPDASELPAEDFERLSRQVRAMGFWGLDIPAEYGGAGVDLVTRVLMAVEMAQHRAGLYAPCYGVFGSAGLAQLYEATEAQKQRYLHPMLRGEKRGFFGLTEPSGGSDPARAIRTRAVGTAATGSSTAPRCSSPAPTRPTSASCSRAPTPRRAGPASPASSSTRT